MRRVKYGTIEISYDLEINPRLKNHYISVDSESGVVLKGRPITATASDKLVLSKAPWILKKLDLVKGHTEVEIVTGSRLKYLGRSFYVKLVNDGRLNKVRVDFNHSIFKITCPGKHTSQAEIADAIELFYRVKAIEKITARLNTLSQRTGLNFKGVQFRKMNKRWASCTGGNRIIINIECVKLPFSLIDYVLIHELCHTKVKDHSKQFWREVSRWEREWKAKDDLISRYQV